MMRDPSVQTSRTERATDVEIESTLQAHAAEPADFDDGPLPARQDQRIRAGISTHLRIALNRLLKQFAASDASVLFVFSP